MTANRKKRKKRTLTPLQKKQLLSAALHLGIALLSGLISGAELLFGVRPFGIALTAAATEYLPAAALGMAVSSILVRDPLSLLSLGVLLIFRFLFSTLAEEEGRERRFAERGSLRIAAAAVAVAFSGTFAAVRGGYRYFDLFALILAAVAAPLACFLYIGAFEDREDHFPLSREAGVGALIFTAIFAMRHTELAGIYPAAVAAALFSFVFTAKKGMWLGISASALAGLSFDPRLAPAFFLTALLFSLTEKGTRGGGVLMGAAAGAAWGFFIGGLSGFSMLLPSILFAGALFLAFDSTGLVEGAPSRRVALARKRAAEQSAAALALGKSEQRLDAISSAFLDLSSTFFELCDRARKPSQSDMKRLTDRTFDKVCPDCPMRDSCWNKSYAETAGAVSVLGTRLYTKGKVTEGDFPIELLKRCRKTTVLSKKLNEGAVKLTEEALRGDKTAVIASDYAAIGRLLRETIEKTRASYYSDTTAGIRIGERLARQGFILESATVCGKEHRTVALRGVRLPGEHLKVRELRRILEEHCHFALGDPHIETVEGLADITFPERPVLTGTTVQLTRPRIGNQSRHCGDSITTLQTEDGYDYVFLCDGMGSGKTAAITSMLSATVLARLLRAGSGAEQTLKMLNTFLAARGRHEQESSTTVDLLEIDRISGEGRLYKCGAAPTLLLRDGKVTTFFSKTAPVGILDVLDAERIRIDLLPGDVLVHISDGVSGGEESCEWLARMLEEKWDEDAEKFTRLVLARASADSEDDLSVAVTQLRAASLACESRESA